MAKKWHHRLRKPSNMLVGGVSCGSLTSSYAMATSETFVSSVGQSAAFALANGSAIVGLTLPIASVALAWKRRHQSHIHSSVLKTLENPSMLGFIKEYLQPVSGDLYELTKPSVGFAVQYVDTKNRADLSAAVNERAFQGQLWSDTREKKKARNRSFAKVNSFCQAMIKNPSDIAWDLLPAGIPHNTFAANTWRRPFVGLSVILPLLDNAKNSYFSEGGVPDNEFPSNYICQNSAQNRVVRTTDDFLLFTSCLDTPLLKGLDSTSERFKYFRLISLVTMYHLHEIIEMHGKSDVVDVWVQNDSSRIGSILSALGFRRAIGMKTADCDTILHMQLRLKGK